MKEWENKTWNLDGTEELSPWPKGEIKKYQTKYGIAFEMYLGKAWYTSTHRCANMEPTPYWDNGRLPT